MSQTDNHTRPAEIIEELSQMAPTLAKFKTELSKSGHPWSEGLAQKDWNTAKSSPKTITMNFMRYAAALVPLIAAGYFILSSKLPSEQLIVDVSELEQDIVLELLADQAYYLRTEDLLDVSISTNLINEE